MRKLLFIAALTLPLLGKGQVYFQGSDSITIETPISFQADIWQVRVQNLDDISESVAYWTYEGTGNFFAPWCNVRVSRTSFMFTGLAGTENWSVDLKRVDVHFSASALPNRQVKIQVFGGDYDLRIRHYAYGNWYMFYEGNSQHFPEGHFLEGERTFSIPYRIKGAQVATVVIHAGACSQKIGRIFYLN